MCWMGVCACVGMYVLDGSVCLCRGVCAGWECACVGMYVLDGSVCLCRDVCAGWECVLV